MQHELVNAARVPKAHFGLRRMHVDVDAARIDLEEQQVTGLALAVQHLRVGFARGVRQHPVAHAAAVYEEVLRLGPRLRRSCVPEYAQRAGLRLDRQRGVDEFASQVLEAADLARGVARERERQVVARYAGAVVVDLDALRAALVQRHGNGARVRVEAVLEQLLQHRRGPLDYLAGSDLAHQEIGQDADRWHAKSI